MQSIISLDQNHHQLYLAYSIADIHKLSSIYLVYACNGMGFQLHKVAYHIYILREGLLLTGQVYKNKKGVSKNQNDFIKLPKVH